jgi:glycosyltransferase involved in cell wall biosynthesis
MRIAIVHDYLNQYGGAEKVVEKWLEMYPEADVYTTIYVPQNFKSSEIYQKTALNNQIHTTWLQVIFKHKFFLKFFKHFFWLYPIVMTFKVVKNYDVVLISSTYCAKNVRYENCKKLIHYCHSPVRFLHGLITETDHKSLNWLFKSMIPLFTFWLKWMDLRAVKYLNNHGCIWIGNSKFICQTIKDVYKTDSLLIYPPIEIQNFLKIDRNVFSETSKSFYLCHGRISFHKRLDLAIAACLELGRSLKIGGTSSLKKEMDELKSQVENYVQKNPEKAGLVEFLGRTTDEQFFDLLQKSRAFLFPGKEDSGITPLEVFASGTPVIAYQAGGALEYLKDGENGLFFPDQTVESLKEVMLKFESKTDWNAENIKDSSKAFSSEVFVKEMKKLIN